MSYNNPFATQTNDNVAPFNGNKGNGNFKKATAFINLSLPRDDGTTGKLESIKLYDDREDHAALIKMFQEDPTKAAELVARNLVMDFRMAEGPKAAFALK